MVPQNSLMYRIFYVTLLALCFVGVSANFAISGGLGTNNANACIKPDLGPDRNLCGTLGTLEVPNPGDYTAFDWQRYPVNLSPKPATTVKILTITTAGTYILKATDINGCVSSDTVNITNSLPTVNLNFNVKAYANANSGLIELKGDSTCGSLGALLRPDLADTSHAKYRFSWNTGRTRDTTAALRVKDSYNYQLTATDKISGCSKTQGKVYRVVNLPQICINVTKDNGTVSLGYDSLKIDLIAGQTGVAGSNNGVGASASFAEPWDIVYFKNQLFVSDKGNNKIRRINLANNNVSDFLGDGSINILNAPTGLAIDRAGNFYIANEAGNYITKYDNLTSIASPLAGTLNGAAGYSDGQGNNAKFNSPKELFTDSLGFVYVSDYNNHSIRKIAPNGTVTTVSGAAPPSATSGYVNGDGTAARYSYPWGLTIDRSGSIFISEAGNNTIRKLDLTYKATRFAGLGGSSGSNSSIIGVGVNGGSAGFNKPANLGLSRGGNLLVSDAGNNNFRKIDKQPVVTTLLGMAGTPGSTDGGKVVARLNTPSGVATDEKGNYYIADRATHTIRKISRNKTVIVCLADTNNVRIDGYCSYQTDPTSGYIFAWTKNGSSDFDGKDASSFSVTKRDANYATPDVYVLTLSKIVRLDNNFTNNCVEISRDTVFVYFKAPPAGLTITTSKGTSGAVCSNDSITLYAPKKYKYYTWTIGQPLNLGGTIVAQGTLKDTIKVGAPAIGKQDHYYVLVTDTAAPGCQYQIDKNITPIAAPVVDIKTADTSICVGASVKLTTDMATGLGITYTWTPQTHIIAGGGTASNTATVKPPVQTRYKVLVRSSFTQCANSDSVLITVNPQPFVTAGNDTGVCLGGNVLLNAKVITESSAPYTFTWSTIPAGSTLSGQNNVLTGPTSGRTWQVLLTDAKNCTARDTMAFTINPIPLANASLRVTTICPQQQVELGVTGSGGTPQYHYLWTPDIAINNDTLQKPLVSPLTTTRYTVKVTDSQGCYGVDTTLVKTTGFAITDFSPKPTAVICEGKNLQLNPSARIVGGVQPYTINWDQPALLSSTTIINPIATPTNTITPTKFVMTVSESGGCVLKDSVTITVSTKPSITVSADTGICAGATAALSIASVTGGTAPYTYNWTEPTDGGLASTTGSSVLATPTAAQGVLTYGVTVADVAGCAGNSDQVKVTVNRAPDLELGDDTIACDGATVKLNAYNAANGSDPISYSWTGGGVVGSDPAILNVTTAGTYSVAIQNTLTQCVNNDSRTVTFSIPLSGLTLDMPASVCKYDQVEFKAALLVGKDPIQYIWTVTDGTRPIYSKITTSNSLRDSIVLAPSFDYPDLIGVKVEAKNQCTVTPVSDTKDYSYYSTPKAVISSVAPNPANLFLPVTFTQASVFDKSLIWDFKDGSSLLETSNSEVNHTYTVSGSYAVVLTAVNNSGCLDSTSFVVDVNNKFELFIPNVFAPASSNNDNNALKVFGIGISGDDFYFAVYNRWGQLVFQTEDYSKAANIGWNGRMKSDGEELPGGVYTYVLKGKFTDGNGFNQSKAVTLVR